MGYPCFAIMCYALLCYASYAMLLYITPYAHLVGNVCFALLWYAIGLSTQVRGREDNRKSRIAGSFAKVTAFANVIACRAA